MFFSLVISLSLFAPLLFAVLHVKAKMDEGKKGLDKPRDEESFSIELPSFSRVSNTINGMRARESNIFCNCGLLLKKEKGGSVRVGLWKGKEAFRKALDLTRGKKKGFAKVWKISLWVDDPPFEAWGRRRDNGTLFYFVHGKLCPLERTNEPSGREKGNTTLKMGLEKKKERDKLGRGMGGKDDTTTTEREKKEKTDWLGLFFNFLPPLFSWEIRTEPQENIPQKYTMGRH